ncbi:MAG: hypothetical protein FJ213_12930 [Ignavibacteria bacterium]|nr:hypothetical protein [Ignavibacteria bacterium]
METALMISLVIIFGIWSIISKKYNSKSTRILDLVMLSLAITILIITAFTVEENRYIAIVFIIIGLSFSIKKIKELRLKNPD